MIVRQLQVAEASPRRINGDGWQSTRLLLKGDDMGFSFHITMIDQGAELSMHYQNHLESVYCIEGEGEIEDIATGEVHAIRPGTIYALDRHDKHILRATSRLQLACVFNPPLIGKETHNAEGAYEVDSEPIDA